MKKHQEAKTLPPLPVQQRHVDAAVRQYRRRARTRDDHKARNRFVERNQERINSLAEAICSGEAMLPAPAVKMMGKRSIVVFEPLSRIAIAAATVRTQEIFGEATPLNLQTTLRRVSTIAEKLSRQYGRVLVAALDVVDAFDSTPLELALADVPRVCPLTVPFYRAVYAFPNPETLTLRLGVSSSSFLFERVMNRVDSALSRYLGISVHLIRYADDLVVVAPNVDPSELAARVENALDIFATEHGYRLRVHRHRHAVFDHQRGFLSKFDYLGIEFDGQERRADPARLLQRLTDSERPRNPSHVLGVYRDVLSAQGYAELKVALGALGTASTSNKEVDDNNNSRTRRISAQGVSAHGDAWSDTARKAGNNPPSRGARTAKKSAQPADAGWARDQHSGTSCNASCQKRLRSPDGRMIIAPRPLLEHAEGVAAMVLGRDVTALRDELGMLRARYPNELARSCEHYLTELKGKPVRLPAGFCGEHSRQIARAYIFAYHFLVSGSGRITDITAHEFYAVGTLTGNRWWVIWFAHFLMEGQRRRWWGGRTTRACVEAFRSWSTSIRFHPMWHPLEEGAVETIFAAAGITVRPNADDAAWDLGNVFSEVWRDPRKAKAIVKRMEAYANSAENR